MRFSIENFGFSISKYIRIHLLLVVVATSVECAWGLVMTIGGHLVYANWGVKELDFTIATISLEICEAFFSLFISMLSGCTKFLGSFFF